MSDLIERPALANFLLDYLEQWEAGNGGCAAMVPKRSQGQFYGGVREGLTEAAQAITALTAERDALIADRAATLKWLTWL